MASEETEPLTLVRAWTRARETLKAAGIDSPAIDARLLLEAAAGVSRTDIVADPYRSLDVAASDLLEAYVARRSAREPVSRILGRRGFWKIMLNVSPDVLTPRPDTETIVEGVLSAFDEHRRFSVLDLGVGSGAILLAILAERPLARGLGVDISEEALAVARENAANLGLEARTALLRGDWTEGLGDESFDLVVSNPPYIASEEIKTLDPEVRDHEPRIALDGGVDGLAAYRRLAPEIMRVLKPDGVFAVEIGWTQAEAVEAIFQAAGALDVRTRKDLANRDRVVGGAKKPLGNPFPTR
jgi:release factor glutamine methyltransferase